MAARRSTATAGDRGFTVIELAVAMVVLGSLIALGTPAYNRYQTTQEHVSAAREITSTFRNAQMRATSEATTYRVDIDPSTRRVTVLRFDGSTYVQRRHSVLRGRTLQVQSVAFRDRAGALVTSAFFYPRGTASPGSVVLARQGSERRHTVLVEGLTGRVSTS